jgi:hypothetical protein
MTENHPLNVPFVVRYLPNERSRKERTFVTHAPNRIAARKQVALLWNSHPEYRPKDLSMLYYRITKVVPLV